MWRRLWQAPVWTLPQQEKILLQLVVMNHSLACWFSPCAFLTTGTLPMYRIKISCLFLMSFCKHLQLLFTSLDHLHFWPLHSSLLRINLYPQTYCLSFDLGIGIFLPPASLGLKQPNRKESDSFHCGGCIDIQLGFALTHFWDMLWRVYEFKASWWPLLIAWSSLHACSLHVILTDDTWQSPVTTCFDLWAAGPWLSQQPTQGIHGVDLLRKLVLSRENDEWGCKN